MWMISGALPCPPFRGPANLILIITFYTDHCTQYWLEDCCAVKMRTFWSGIGPRVIDAASLGMMNAHKLTFAQPCPVLPSLAQQWGLFFASSIIWRWSANQRGPTWPLHLEWNLHIYISSFGFQVSWNSAAEYHLLMEIWFSCENLHRKMQNFKVVSSKPNNCTMYMWSPPWHKCSYAVCQCGSAPRWPIDRQLPWQSPASCPQPPFHAQNDWQLGEGHAGQQFGKTKIFSQSDV